MAITIADIIIPYDTFIGDTSNDRVSAAERLQYLTESTMWLSTELDNDHSVKTYSVSYFDTINSYKLNAALTDVLEGNALRRATSENNIDMTRKDSRQVMIDISNSAEESSYSLERKNENLFLAVNHDSKYRAMQVSSLASLTADGGTWEADETNSDALDLEADSVDGSNGTNGCLKFDIDVSQSVNNRGTIFNDEFTEGDLTEEEDLSSWLLDVKFPEVTNITSVTFYWGSDSSNYWSVTSTTNQDGGAFTADFDNTVKFTWQGATKTGSPDVTAIDYLRIDINYGAGQTDATSFKVDNLRLVRPESLKFYYTSWNGGADTAGDQIKKFGATTDVPYFSGQYDQYLYAVAHKAASLTFRALRLYGEADREELEATREMDRIRQVIPKSRPGEAKNFKVLGISFGGRRRR